MSKGSYITNAPLTAPGCVLYLDGNDPNGTGVPPADATAIATPFDFSGAANAPTQGTGSKQALFKRDIVGSRGALLFDGVDDTYVKTNFEGCSLADYEIYIAFTSISNFRPCNIQKSDQASGILQDFALGATTWRFLHRKPISTSGGGAQSVLASAITQNVPVIVNDRRDSAGAIYATNVNKLTADGTVATSAADALGVGNNLNLYVGSAADITFTSGYLHYLIIYNVTHTTAQRQSILRFMANSLGVSLAA